MSDVSEYVKIFNETPMTGEEFRQWIVKNHLTQREAATLIGRGYRQVNTWCSPKDAEKLLPLTVHLAVCWINLRILQHERRKQGVGSAVAERMRIGTEPSTA